MCDCSRRPRAAAGQWRALHAPPARHCPNLGRLSLACPHAPTPAEREALLSFKAGITNWDEAAAARGLAGWDAAAPVCTWSGIECSPFVDRVTNYVTEMRVRGQGAGAACWHLQMAAAWRAAAACTGVRACVRLPPPSPPPPSCSLCRHLSCLAGCSVPFEGRLGGSINRLQHLRVLHLGNNSLSGPLPVEWGEPGSFPELEEL